MSIYGVFDPTNWEAKMDYKLFNSIRKSKNTSNLSAKISQNLHLI